MSIDINPIEILSNQLEEVGKSTIEMAPQLFAAFVFLVLVFFVKKVILYTFSKATVKSTMRPSLKRALATIINIAVWVFGVMIAAMIAMPDLTPAKLLAGLGVGSIAVGLAFKDTFENFLAGILILIRKPMRIDDYIECEDINGQVKEINVRETYVRKTDGTLIMVPNGYLYKNPLRVITDQATRRVTIMCGVGYGENIDEARSVIKNTVEGLKSVNKDKPVQIFAQGFGDSSIDFEVTWWTKSKPFNERESRDEVVAAVKAALDNAGIEIPFPYRTLTFSESLKLDKSDGQ